MSIASIGEAIENPSVTQLLAAYPTKEAFDAAVKSGKIKPTTEAGVAANIFNRIVQSAMANQAQAQAQTTVFQDNTQPMGLAAAAQAPQMQQPQGQGLDQVPIPEAMFDEQRMAGGGIVAFQPGGAVPNPSFAGMYQNMGPELAALAAARKAYMGNFPTESEEERLRRRKEEQALRLMEAGLGIAGGTSPYFAANLKGAVPAIQGYAGDVAAQRKEDLARLAASRAEQGKVFESVIGSREKAEQRASAEKIAEMQASKGTNMSRFADDAVAATAAKLGRKLTDEEEAQARMDANERYVRLSAALDPRIISAQASQTQAATSATRATADVVNQAMGDYKDAFNIKNRGLLPKDVLNQVRAAERAEKEGKTQEGQRLRLEIYNSFRVSRGLEPVTTLPGGTLGAGATRAAPAAGKLPPGFVEE